MLLGFITLISFQLFGFIIVAIFNLPIPAPVVGLVALFVFLLIKGHVSEPLVKIATYLLPLLPLFLIPASTGIVRYGDLLSEEWLAITTAIVVSMVLTVVVVPFIFMFFIKLFGNR